MHQLYSQIILSKVLNNLDQLSTLIVLEFLIYPKQRKNKNYIKNGKQNSVQYLKKNYYL